MALLDSKQLNPKLTGSFILSGSTQTFIGASDFQGSITASGNISGSLTSTGSFGYVNVAGNIGLNEYIHHNGDIDTYIRYQPDQIDIVVGAQNMIYMVEGAGGNQEDKVTINNDLTDVDFQVKGDNEANLIRTVATTDRVGIGIQSPTEFLHISGSGITKLFVEGDISGSVSSTGSFGRLEIAGNSNLTGDLTLGGNITLGDATSDSVSFGAEISSSIVPDADSTYDVGSSSKNWRFGYIEQLSTTHVTASGNISGSVSSTGSFGSVVVSDKVQGNLKIGEGIVYNDTNKRLGIGDPVPTSPESELHIKAATPEITIQRTDNDNDGVIDFQGSAGYVGAKIAHSGTDNNLVFHTYTGSTLKERLTITGGSAGTKISGSAVSTGSFGALRVAGQALTVNSVGTVSGSSTSTGSFGRLEVAGVVNASGNVRGSRFEIDGATEYIDTSLGNLFIVTTGDIAAQPGTGKALKVTGGLSATSHITASGDVYVSGNISGSSTSTGSFGRVSTSTLDLDSIQGNWTNAGNTVADGGTVTTIDINGGTVDGATVGASSHTTIKGTTIDATTDFTIGATVLTDNQIANDGSFTLDIAGDINLDADGGDVTITDNGADLLTINATTISGSATSTGSFASIVLDNFISGSSSTSASFGRIDTAGSIYASGRVYEAGTSIVDHATAMAIVFGG
jgi:hypothetical protein